MSADDLDIDHLSEPDRFAKVARLHQNAFAWRPQGPNGLILSHSWNFKGKYWQIPWLSAQT
jgi:hypothetical protein